MSTTITVRLDGAEAFRASVGALELRLRAGVAALVRRYAEVIAREARGFAPVDTGALRGSIETVLAGVDATLSGEVAVRVAYAAYVELGTSRAPAQPYLFPAFRAHVPAFVAELRALLGGR